MTLVTPATVERAIAEAPDGARLVLEGVFPALPLKRRRPGLVLDLTRAEVLTQVRTGSAASPIEGLTLLGGIYHQGVDFTEGRDVTIRRASLRGGAGRAFNGAAFNKVTNVELADCEFRDVQNGVVLQQSPAFRAVRSDFERVRKDVFNVTACAGGVIAGNRSRDHRPEGIGTPTPDHCDAVQMLNRAGLPATSDILICDNDFDIVHGQGITQTWKVNKGDPRFARIHYLRNRVTAGAPYGFGMIGVDGGTIGDNVLMTHDGSMYLSRFVVDASCRDIVWTGRNAQAAWGHNPARDWPATAARAVLSA